MGQNHITVFTNFVSAYFSPLIYDTSKLPNGEEKSILDHSKSYDRELKIGKHIMKQFGLNEENVKIGYREIYYALKALAFLQMTSDIDETEIAIADKDYLNGMYMTIEYDELLDLIRYIYYRILVTYSTQAYFNNYAPVNKKLPNPKVLWNYLENVEYFYDYDFEKEGFFIESEYKIL